ncbi:MAG: ferredoxin [Burkholderiales bacterium]|nr:ferredoxin [Burkholderiales bacterium]
MHAEVRSHIAFYLTEKQALAEAADAPPLGLRPALLARYRDLARLRYDYPVALLREAAAPAAFAPLGALVARAVERAAAAADDPARYAAPALALELELRTLAARGTPAPLATLADAAAGRLARGADAPTAEMLDRLRRALAIDAELVECDAALPARLVTHLWQSVQQRKAAAFRDVIDRLVLKLGEILQADRARSAAARTPEALRAAMGTVDRDAFDFEAMAQLLARLPERGALSSSRRQRIEATLAVLAAQRFFPASGVEPYAFRFADCADALAAFRERLPEMAKLARAVAVARLEIEGEYSEPRHDALFERILGAAPDLRALELFPHYLVCVDARALRARGHDALMELLAGALPVKVLVQSDDILEETLAGTGQVAFGAHARQLTSMAMGMNEVFVLQAAASHLVRAGERLQLAMEYSGPALVSVFSGACAHADGVPPYLYAAAAMESRAFPAFAFEPVAGPDRAAQFSLAGNPQEARDWPVHRLDYEDAEHQGVSEEVAFTLADFVACDRRYANHFERVPRAHWGAPLAPLAQCLDRQAKDLPEKLPCLLMVDDANRLHKVMVDERLVRETRRCRDFWRSLRALGARRERDAARAGVRDAQPPAAAQAPSAMEAPPAAPETAAPATERPAGDPYIETARCSSCDECIQVNNRMFAYDENKQARIVDPNAGTYRQLVEAAESCQVAIIHPGKPRNPGEPGLEGLLRRAEPFQ